MQIRDQGVEEFHYLITQGLLDDIDTEKQHLHVFKTAYVSRRIVRDVPDEELWVFLLVQGSDKRNV